MEPKPRIESWHRRGWIALWILVPLSVVYLSGGVFGVYAGVRVLSDCSGGDWLNLCEALGQGALALAALGLVLAAFYAAIGGRALVLWRDRQGRGLSLAVAGVTAVSGAIMVSLYPAFGDPWFLWAMAIGIVLLVVAVVLGVACRVVWRPVPSSP